MNAKQKRLILENAGENIATGNLVFSCTAIATAENGPDYQQVRKEYIKLFPDIKHTVIENLLSDEELDTGMEVGMRLMMIAWAHALAEND